MTTPEPLGAAPESGQPAPPSPTQQPYPQPSYPPPAPDGSLPNAPEKKQLNVLGLISLIVAGIGFIFACIPGALILGWVLLPIAFVLALVSLFLNGKGKGLGIAGLIVSIVGTIVGVIVFVTVVAGAFGSAFGSGETTVDTNPSTSATNDSATEEESAADDQGTRQNPYPIGSVIENDEWRVVINSVTLGANDAVAAANSFNEPPADGNEYIVVNYSTTYLGDDAEGALPGFVIVEYVTADGTTVNSYDSLVVAPDPVFDTTSTLYTDGTATGNVVFEVPTASAGDGVLAIQPGMVSDKVFVAVK